MADSETKQPDEAHPLSQRGIEYSIGMISLRRGLEIKHSLSQGGALQLDFTEMQPNVIDNPIGVCQNINVRISQNPKPQSRQFSVSNRIFLPHLRFKVLTSIDLYDDHIRWAIEVNNVVADGLLPVELQAL